MHILSYADAVTAITSVPEYLGLLNNKNISIRGSDTIVNLMIRRQNAVVDIHLSKNRVYMNAIRDQCSKYTRYRRYTQFTGIILSDGSDEQLASHCCGNNIVFSIPMMGSIDNLFPHELWHIISRQLPNNVLDSVYAVFDIHPTLFYIPPELSEVLLINPDNLNIYYSHTVNGYQIVVLPVISDRMFGTTLAFLIKDGTMYQLDIDQTMFVKQYISAVCGTTYISGADEIIADNFANFHTVAKTTRNTKMISVIPLG